jgi:hypothetical protein
VFQVRIHLFNSDEFELKFPGLSRAELERLRAEPGHLNFRAETKLTLCTSIRSKFLPHRNFSYFVLLSLRLGAQSVTLLSTLRDPTQLRRRQCVTRQQHPFFVAHQKEGIVRCHNLLTSTCGCMCTLWGPKLMSGSCHIRSVEIVVELRIFVFF